MRIDWIAKLQHLLQTVAFCLAIATLQVGFMPWRPYAPAVVFSVLIGTFTWAVIDLGRHLLPSARETGWPAGWSGLLLVAGGIVAGFVAGTAAGEALSQAYGLLPPGITVSSGPELRSSLLVTLVAGVVGTYWFYSRSKNAYLERKMGEAQRHADEARLKLLETQLEPHMLFNTLANLRALIAVDPQRAQQMLDHMIAYLRATLDASRATTHGLQAEFDRLRDYLELMAIRMGPRLAYTLALPPELAAQLVPALLLQPLVENSIQHGLEPQVQGGRITVSARCEGAQLVLEVADTGAGRAPPAPGGRGFGLTQIRERLATLHGPVAGLDLVPNDGGGMRAVVRLPLQP